MITTARRAPPVLRHFGALFAVSLALLIARDTGPVLTAQAVAAQGLVPIQRAMTDLTQTASALWAAIDEIDRLRADNVRLRAAADALTLENVRLRERAIQAEQLAKLGAMAETIDRPAVSARVIARDPRGIMRSLTLDVGSDQGVAAGDVVVSAEGLVGRVTQVGPNFARVLPITDSASTIVAMVQSSRATGIVRGLFGQGLVLEWVLGNERMVVGDVVITAGLSVSEDVRSLYPAGLFIGVVTEVQHADVQAYQRAVLRPAVDLRTLERVLVVSAH